MLYGLGRAIVAISADRWGYMFDTVRVFVDAYVSGVKLKY